MKHRNLGSLTVSEIGLGCMGMSAFYGTADEAEAIATIRRALELGCKFLDTAQTYGPFKNEELVAKAPGARREEVVIATKFAWRYEQAEDGSWTRTPDGSPANAREGLEGSLRRLGTDYVDLYYLHRLDPDDWRRTNPRFQGEALEQNLRLVAKVEELAAEKGCTPGQLALAWVLAQGDDIVPIPGTKRVKYLEENLAAAEIELTSDDLARIASELPAAVGDRYDEAGMAAIDR